MQARVPPSALLKLLANYYKDYEGEILIGEQELRMIERKSLGRKIAMIHQNVFLFEDTLRANITMFQEYPDEEIKAAGKGRSHAGSTEKATGYQG